MLATYFRRLVIRARQGSDDRIRELEAGTLQNPERFHFDFTSSVHHEFEIDPAVNAGALRTTRINRRPACGLYPGWTLLSEREDAIRRKGCEHQYVLTLYCRVAGEGIQGAIYHAPALFREKKTIRARIFKRKHEQTAIVRHRLCGPVARLLLREHKNVR